MEMRSLYSISLRWTVDFSTKKIVKAEEVGIAVPVGKWLI